MSQSKDNAEISLHLDEKVVGAKAFVRGVRAFIGLIDEVASYYEKGLTWGVTVREGSNVVSVRPTIEPNLYPLAMECFASVEAGLGVLEDRPELPVAFSTAAVIRTKRLAEVVQEVGGFIQGPTRPCRLSSQAVANVDKLLGSPYRAIGSLEGELLLLSAVRGTQIGIRDAITGRVIHCGFDENDIDELATEFHKRISVRGYMKYRPDGSIARIDVETYRVLRDASTLPSADDVRGILREH